jgi:CBS domain-containing protein
VVRREVERIRNLERMLVADGVAVVKLHLHVGPELQRRRLRRLQKDPTTRWRVTAEDRWYMRHYAQVERAFEHCLEATEWRERFAGWIREPTPEALLGANIFFDFRPLAGNVGLAENLRAWLRDLAAGNRLFLRMLVANALQAEPPLGRIRKFRTDEGEHAGTLDLKSYGTRIYVDAARAFALGLGITETNTSQRLRLAGRRLGIEERETDSAVEGYHFLQLLRLRAQRGELETEIRGPPAKPHAAVNRIDPYALNDLDQRLLKESFRQARQLQTQLERAFGQ